MSFDTVEDNKHFAEKFHFPFPLLCDTSRTMGAQYGACEPGATSGNAKRIAYIIAPDGKVRNVFAKVDPKTFVQDVLALL